MAAAWGESDNMLVFRDAQLDSRVKNVVVR